MKWYKRDPDAALAGMIGLSLEERAVYNTVIDLLYSRDGDLPTDDAFFAAACGCRPQVWRRIRDALIAKKKLHYKQGGKLTANRVETELKTARKLILQKSVSSEKPNKNNDPPLREAVAPADTTTTTARKEREGDARAREPLISSEAFALADEYRTVTGVDADDPGWVGFPYTAQIWITRGYQREIILSIGARLTHNKRMSYHAAAIEGEYAKQAAKPRAETSNAKAFQHPAGDWRGRRDKQHEALAELRAFNESVAASDQSGSSNGEVVFMVPHAGRR